MVNDGLVELSPGAAAQLGRVGDARAAVRVRRVNPPEQERAMLRAGQHAPERMATPKGLLDALNRKLAAGRPLNPAPSAVAPAGAKAPAPRGVHVEHKPQSKPQLTTKTASAVAAPGPAPAATTAAHGALVVQVAALSTQSRAHGLATDLGGSTSSSGRLWRVRLGPFATAAEAQAALAKARAAGYSDARIQRAD
jgi:rare lipoprotein A